MPHEAPDIVVFYADLGRPYLPLIDRMVRSAKEVMPESRLVLLTPTPDKELISRFDLPLQTSTQSTVETVCYDKACAIISWQMKSDRPCIFADPDLEFVRPVEFPDEDVALIWRRKSAQPVNAGMILARPGCPTFWNKYGVTVGTLPVVLRPWWIDQLAFSVMIGARSQPGEVVNVHDARVRLLPETCCAPPERANEDTWALHYKGHRKGEGWGRYFATHQPVEQRGDGWA